MTITKEVIYGIQNLSSDQGFCGKDIAKLIDYSSSKLTVQKVNSGLYVKSDEIKNIMFASNAKFIKITKEKITCSCCSKLSEFSFKNDAPRIVNLCGTHSLIAINQSKHFAVQEAISISNA